MTDMQLIVPPLEEQSEQGAVKGEGTAQNRSGDGNDGQGNNDVLSPELREHFEAMKALWRQSRRSSSDGDEDLEELRHKSREKALETALAVESETLRLQNGIAELEALLAQQERGQVDENAQDGQPGNDDNASERDDAIVARDVILFPFLPPVVAPEEEESSISSGDGMTTDPKTTTSFEHDLDG